MEAVNQEKAVKLLDEWIELYEAEIQDDTRGVLLRGIKSGRLQRNSEGDFVMRLIKPLELENGETLDRIVIKEPTVDDVRRACRAGDDFSQTMMVIAASSKQPIGIINRLQMRDVSLAGSVLAFFV